MKKILIIRSVSFQQLDLNLPAIKEKFGESNIALLTHEHGVKLAEKYSLIDDIYVYPYKEGFNYGNKVKELEAEEFDMVIVPVTNISGGGFFNVLKYSLSIRTKERIICNVVSDMKSFSKKDIYMLQIRDGIMKGISLLLAALASIFVLAILPFKLFSIRKR